LVGFRVARQFCRVGKTNGMMNPGKGDKMP